MADIGPLNPQTQSNSLNALIHQEAQKYGVPDWIIYPLVTAESGGNPGAQNGQYTGLLQIGPNYPGVTGSTNLSDPQTNLDIGLPPIAAAYQAEGSPGQSLGAYEYALSHSGHDTWLGWSNENPLDAGNFVNAYQTYTATNGLNNAVSQGVENSGPVQAFGHAGNAIGNSGVGQALSSGGAIGKTFSDLGSAFSWLHEHPGYIVVALAALVVLIGSGAHMFGGAVPKVIPV